jgi:hypothetical protein
MQTNILENMRKQKFHVFNLLENSLPDLSLLPPLPLFPPLSFDTAFLNFQLFFVDHAMLMRRYLRPPPIMVTIGRD